MENEQLLRYYIQELTYLRRAGAAFAESYPKIASRLELSENEIPDPHVERLIEAFAFLTGRVQYNIDSEFTLFTSALLDNLYPHYIKPTPSMAITQFEVDPEQGMLNTGHTIDAHTPLFTTTEEGDMCRFRTAYPVTLWPFNLSHSAVEPTSRYDFLDASPEVVTLIRLRVENEGAAGLNEMELDKLRFHLHGMWVEVSHLYELLFCNVLRVGLLRQGATHPVILPPEYIREVGFEEAVIPYQTHAHPAYRLLHEYFAFPEKFMFFDLFGLDQMHFDEDDTYFDILFMLDRRPPEGMRIREDTFRMGCTPVINLFRKISEPLRLDQRRTEYRLEPDLRHEESTEIHTILKVSASTDDRHEATVVQPFFSFRHHMEGKEHRYFWLTRREPAERAELPGSEMFITFMNLDFNPELPPNDTLYAHLLCTNRHICAQVPARAEFQIEETAPLQRIYCLDKPTYQVDPPMRGETVWRLISHVSLNYLSLSADSEETLTALREILRLYSFIDNAKSVDRQIMGIRALSTRQIVRRMGPDAWRGFARGYEINLKFDNDLYVGSSAFLLASVLNHFFPLYTSSNSFTQLVIKNTESDDLWKKWLPRTGRKILL